ncbi:MAG TPA: fluoride efflux transporter CrcB [Solirubrobacterales bacterium]|nr:fluoride efflux transporter CrcB [Solirubrobacterales bacterium]
MRSLPHDPRKLLAIYLGGVVGALVRVGLAEVASTDPGQWPWATFAANMAGALLLGYFYALFRDRPPESLRHPFLGIGLCGTLTTFSTLQLELYEMVDGGYLGLAAAYTALTIAAGYVFLRLGIALEARRGDFMPVSGNKSPRGRRR